MLLEKALKKSEGALKDSIRYYLALDYLETAKRAQAMELFEELAAGSLFQEQATQKLSRMSR